MRPYEAPSGTVYYSPVGSVWEYNDAVFLCLEGHIVDSADGDKLRRIYVLYSGNTSHSGHTAFAYSSPVDTNSMELR